MGLSDEGWAWAIVFFWVWTFALMAYATGSVIKHRRRMAAAQVIAAPQPEPEKCHQCRWFDADEAMRVWAPDDLVRECRCDAPVSGGTYPPPAPADNTPYQHQSVFPLVFSTDYCGDFERYVKVEDVPDA